MKVALSVLLVLGVSMLVAWPWILGKQPPAAHHAELARYSVRFGLYICTLAVVFFSTTVLAFALLRRARDEYREHAMGNLKFLIESSLQDHRKPDETHDA